jgi:hypothetical protein
MRQEGGHELVAFCPPVLADRPHEPHEIRARGVRLERAKTLLGEQGTRPSEVAQAVGFENAAHFTRQFKRRYGTPPSRYRERAGARAVANDVLVPTASCEVLAASASGRSAPPVLPLLRGIATVSTVPRQKQPNVSLDRFAESCLCKQDARRREKPPYRPLLPDGGREGRSMQSRGAAASRLTPFGRGGRSVCSEQHSAAVQWQGVGRTLRRFRSRHPRGSSSQGTS